jgi:hypothetical protein
MAASSPGASNSFTPKTAINCVSDQTYQFDLILSVYSSGTFTLTACGVTGPTVTPTAAGDFRFYITDTGTGSPSVSATSSASLTFSNFTMYRAAYDATSLANINVIVDTNAGLTVPLTVYQPAAVAGWTFQEYVIATYAVVVKSWNGSGADTWECGTSTYTGSLTFASVRQTFLTLVSFVTGYWDIGRINGTVTPA